MNFLFGPADKNDIFVEDYGPVMSLRNGIIMHITVEAAFDKFRIAIVPVDPDMDNGRFQVLVMDATLMPQELYPDFKWRQLHRRELVFKGNHRPAKRFLYWHYITALQRASEGFRDVAHEQWQRDVLEVNISRTPSKTDGGMIRDERAYNMEGFANHMTSPLDDAKANRYWGTGGAWLRKAHLTYLASNYGHELPDIDPEVHGIDCPGDHVKELLHAAEGMDIGIPIGEDGIPFEESAGIYKNEDE
jgi:hypothetical protein